MIVVLLIELSVVYLHTLSYKKAQEIYLEETVLPERLGGRIECMEVE